MPKFDKVLINDEIVEKFHADLFAKRVRRREFFTSDVCKRMIGDIIATGEPLSCESVSYLFERVQQTYGWSDLSKEQVEEFINVMSDASDAEVLLDCPDDENPFDHSYHLKGGCVIFMMHGQGTVITVFGPKAVPEYHESLMRKKVQIENQPNVEES